MLAGKLDTLILIERKTVVPDPIYGTETIVWVPLDETDDSPPLPKKVWAEVQDALPSKAEGVVQGLNVAKNQTRIRLRWRNDVRMDMRVTVYRDPVVVMQIVGGPADVDGRKAMIEIMCERYSS